MIFDRCAAIGFHSAPFPGGGTYTLTTYLGVFPTNAEQIAGKRDMPWTILGVEFFGDEKDGAIPHTWFPENCRQIAVRLTRDVALDPPRALFQLAHQACHLISPSGQSGTAPNLEEGFATLVGHRLAEQHAGFRCPVSSKHVAACDMVRDLLVRWPSAIKDIRDQEPCFHKLTGDVICNAVPDMEPGLATRLAARWS